MPKAIRIALALELLLECLQHGAGIWWLPIGGDQFVQLAILVISSVVIVELMDCVRFDG